MFWLGKSAIHRSAIQLFAGAFSAMGLDVRSASRESAKIVDAVVSELKQRKVDPAYERQGDIYLQQQEFMQPRLTAGLSAEDIRSYWNRPLVVVFSERRMREGVLFRHVTEIQSRGGNWEEEALQVKRDHARFGIPEPTASTGGRYNAPEDRYIYPEFGPRVDAWYRKTSSTEREALVAQHGTLNAALRCLIAHGTL